MPGLAWALPTSGRPRAVAGIVAWIVLSAGGADVFPEVLKAGEYVMAAAAPAGDLIDHTVSLLTETLSEIVPTEQIGVVFTRLLTNLDQQRRTQAMQSFLSIPHCQVMLLSADVSYCLQISACSNSLNRSRKYCRIRFFNSAALPDISSTSLDTSVVNRSRRRSSTRLSK